MGKRITTQKRGKGSPRYTAPSHRFKSTGVYRQGEARGTVTGFEDDPSKTTILMKIKWADGVKSSYLAPEGIKVNDEIRQGKAPLAIGNVVPLADIPEGIPIFNIEARPGEGGKVIRASGTAGLIVSKTGGKCVIKLPSKRMKPFNENCFATIGVAAGGGRTEKPLVKAGTNYHKHAARGHLYPTVRGVAMNAIAHPHGGSQHHAGKATTVKRGTSPGRNVGHIAARRTGRRKKK